MLNLNFNLIDELDNELALLRMIRVMLVAQLFDENQEISGRAKERLEVINTLVGYVEDFKKDMKNKSLSEKEIKRELAEIDKKQQVLKPLIDTGEQAKRDYEFYECKRKKLNELLKKKSLTD